MQKVKPASYIACFLEHIDQETDQNTLQLIMGKVDHIMTYFIDGTEKKELSSKIFDALVKKIVVIPENSLRNFLLNRTVSYATSDQQVNTVLAWLKDGGRMPLTCQQDPHMLTKAQRYMVLRIIFRGNDHAYEEKMALLEAEMKTDYSDVDEQQKQRCMACLPEEANKSKLWDLYITNKELSQDMFDFSSGFFFDKSQEAHCEQYSQQFFEQVEMVFGTYHRDYSKIFFHNLSPTFMGKQEHLLQF